MTERVAPPDFKSAVERAAVATDSSARASVVSFLGRNGWAPHQSGRAGELWGPRNLEGEPGEQLAVPWQISWGTMPFRLLVDRLEELLPSENDRRKPSISIIEAELADVQTFKISDEYLIRDEASLQSAWAVLGNARRMLRAAATAARKPRAQIGPNFSVPGDDIADRARLAHTRRGSFVLPVVLPVSPPPSVSNQLPTQFAAPESAERRVTRTLATALNALDTLVVRPDRSPHRNDVFDLIESGVTRELVQAVRGIAANAGVGAFDVSFEWAAATEAPGGLRERVLVPEEASEALGNLAKQLATTRRNPEESVSGQIVMVRQDPDGKLPGELAVQTVRNGRSAEVRLVATPEEIRSAHDWARDQRAVIAYGIVESAAGQRPVMRKPRAIRPLDELFLDNSDGAS